MPSSTYATPSNDECEHCHSTYTLIKRKKTCSVCRQNFCTNCAPRKQYNNQPYRICLICQLISNDSTTDNQLLELKVKHLRCYLHAKNISHHTCTEKQELVDLIKRNRDLPFSRLLDQQNQTSSSSTNNTNQQPSHTASNNSSSSTTIPPPPKSNNNSGPFTNFQHSVSSFANQMNNFATNIQDYVSNTVSGVINNVVGDEPQQQHSTATTNNSNSGTSFNFGTQFNGTGGPFNYSYSTPGSSANTTTTTNTTTTNRQQQQQRRPPPPSAAGATASSSSSTTNQRARRKSLSEIKTEENIEDLNIRELKEVLAANFVDFKGCVEKSELIDKVRRLYRDRQNEKLKTFDDSSTNDTELCKVCMDAVADCVFLDCGHMVTCVKCGKLLAECPICRSNIVRVVRVFKS